MLWLHTAIFLVQFPICSKFYYNLDQPSIMNSNGSWGAATPSGVALGGTSMANYSLVHTDFLLSVSLLHQCFAHIYRLIDGGPFFIRNLLLALLAFSSGQKAKSMSCDKVIFVHN
jgi:hypothetical protein